MNLNELMMMQEALGKMGEALACEEEEIIDLLTGVLITEEEAGRIKESIE